MAKCISNAHQMATKVTCYPSLCDRLVGVMWVWSPVVQVIWQRLLAAPAVAPAPWPLSEPCSLLVPVGVVDCGVTLATMLAEMGGCELVAMLLSGVCTCTTNLQQM